jgi:hypothetical protein
VHVEPADLGGDRLAGLVGQIRDADLGPFGREAERALAADAARRPGDDRDLAVQASDADQPPASVATNTFLTSV